MATPRNAVPTPTPATAEPEPEPIQLPGLGLDIGTANLAVTHYAKVGEKVIKNGFSIRDCFVLFPAEEAAALDVAGVNYHLSKDEKSIFVIGKDAIKLSVALGAELRRPLAQGFVSEREDLSKEILTLLLKSILGEPRFANELVVFSVPGTPVDGDATKALYHTRFFSDRLRELKFKPLPINEAMAVCFADLYKLGDGGKSPLTGLCFSFGAGMINVALVYQSMLSKAFSLPFGGDYVDTAVAKATNSTASQVCVLKEEGINLLTGRPLEQTPYHDAVTDRQAEAIGMVYKDLLTKLRESLTKYFLDPVNRVEIREPLPVIVSGGSAMAPGFLELFNEIVLKDLNIRLPLAGAARLAKDPLGGVALGALRLARLRLGDE